MGGVHAFLQLAVEAVDVEADGRGVVSELGVATTLSRRAPATVGGRESRPVSTSPF